MKCRKVPFAPESQYFPFRHLLLTYLFTWVTVLFPIVIHCTSLMKILVIFLCSFLWVKGMKLKRAQDGTDNAHRIQEPC